MASSMRRGEIAPVVLIVFNRPTLTKRVFDAIAQVQPQDLLVIADGPRPQRPDDGPKCAAARSIVDRVNWPCRLQKRFSVRNCGCKQTIATGLDWVFAVVDRAIILEDDCIPEPSFFRFCTELLDRYLDDQRVRTIAGSNFLKGKVRNEWSYHFSRFHNLSGWATWRRSWARTDLSMRMWPMIRDEGWLVDMAGGRAGAKFWVSRFDNSYGGQTDAWDYPYQFSCWLDHSLSITPNRNLISNVGSGPDATNTPYLAGFMHQETKVMQFPLVHPPFMVADVLSDARTFKNRYLTENSSRYWLVARRLYYFASGKKNRFSRKVQMPAFRKSLP